MAAHDILVVDDDPQLRFLLQQLLTVEGHKVRVAVDGREALAAALDKVPDMIITDVDMPHVDGYDLCRRIKQNKSTRLVPVLIITGRDAFDEKVQAWNQGADDFLSKPYHGVEVLARCRSLLRVKDLVDELDSAESVVFAFARAVEAKSRYTWGHSERVTAYALMLARQVGVSETELEILRKGGMLHDIGKLNIPDAILDKPGPLTDEEYRIVQEHPLQGVRIVEPLRSIRETIPIIRWHHERLDGRGYPDGLMGAAIPLLTRILSVADVYDALSSERPYRPALPHDKCLQMLRDNAAGGGLDPELVRCFCNGPAMTTLGTMPRVGTTTVTV